MVSNQAGATLKAGSKFAPLLRLGADQPFLDNGSMPGGVSIRPSNDYRPLAVQLSAAFTHLYEQPCSSELLPHAGFTILPVSIAQCPTPLMSRGKPRRASFAAVLCLLLMCVISYDAIHVHRSVGPLESAPLTPHHCLLCLAAHFPVTISAAPVAPLPRFTCAAPLPLQQAGSYESAKTFPLYTRPPPQA